MNAPTGSTIIPALGMTFAEGAAKFHALLDEAAPLHATNEDLAEWMVFEACDIRKTMWITPPQTLADAWAVVSVLCDRDDEAILGEAEALELLRDFLATLTKGRDAITLPGAGVGNADTLPAGSDEAAPPQPPYPPKPLTP